MNAQTAQALTIEHEAEQPRAVAVVTPMAMIDRALSANAPVETLEKLLALQERWEANQARKAFDEAMATAKAEIPTIGKNRLVDFTGKTGIRTHYRHEDLAGIASIVDPILSKHGLSYRFRTTNAPNEPITVTCIVSHRQGHCEENTLAGPKDESGNKNSHQAIGSAITYLQRYTLKAALGLAASNDDDARRSEDTSDDGPISEDQAKAIRDLASEVGADLEKFCTYFRIEAVPDLPARDFTRAMQSLEKKRGAK